MKIRFKDSQIEAYASQFNVHALDEVLTDDDSAYIHELDVFINGEWKDMAQAFKDKDIIPDNHNRWFGEPQTEEDKERGYFL